MTLPSRGITIIGVIQAATVIAGFSISRAFRKLWDASLGSIPIPELGIPFVARVIHAGGLWFLAVPVIWVVCACWQADRDGGTVEARQLETIAGWVLTIVLIIFFAVGVVLSIDSLSPKSLKGMTINQE